MVRTAGATLDVREARLRSEVARLRTRLPAYPNRYLYLLMVVTAIDASDRTMLPTVFEDVKRAFDISDTQLGVLTAAYTVVATLSAVPFGFLADRMSRVRLIAIGFVPWSLSMFWGAGAGSFGMLLAARLFLGSIEATNGPSTPSLLGDYYPVARRSRVYGVLAIGGQLGSIIGFVVGGTVATVLGWREAFVALGLVGLVTGFVVSRALPEPERGLPDALHRAETDLDELARPAVVTDVVDAELLDDDEVADAKHVDLRTLSPRESLARVLSVSTMWILAASSTVSLFFTSSLGTWLPTYFRRYHGLSPAAAGGLLSILTLFLIAGTIVGGRHGDRALDAGGPQRRIVIIAGCLFLQLFAWLGLFTVDHLGFGVLCIAVVAVLTGYPLGISVAAVLDIFPSHLRGRASGIQTILRVVATAAAPVLFGVLSDLYGLRSAWLYTLPVLPVAAAITLLAVRTYPSDMRRAQLESLRQHRLEAAEVALDPPEPAVDQEDGGDVDGQEDVEQTDAREPVLVPYAPPPVEVGPSLFERCRALARDATSTPRRAAAATLCAVAALALVIAAMPVGIDVASDRGALRVECGVDSVVFGHPDATVESACRDALGGRSIVFFLSAAVLLAGVGALAQLALARSRREDGGAARLASEITRTPRRSAAAGVVVLAALLLPLSLRSVPVQVADGGGLDVRCGVDTVVLGHPLDAVERACRGELTAEAVVSVGALAVVLAGAVALAALAARRSRGRLGRASERAPVATAVLLAVCALAIVGALVAARPVTVEVGGRGDETLLASCGVDTVLVGHAIPAVEDACRDEVDAHAAALVGAAALAASAVGGLLTLGGRSRESVVRSAIPDWRLV